MTRSLLRAALPASALLVAALAAGFASAAEPTTLLGKWMKPNIGTPLAGQDFPTLQTNLNLVASKPPPGAAYPNWATIAKAGATAAGKQDLAGVKASCKQCHEAYKDSYKKDFADRPFP